MASIYTCATEACIELQEWDQAAVYGQRVIDACRTHLSDANPLIGFYKWRVAKIQAGELNQPLAAKTKLQKAVDNLSIAYGSSHYVTIAAKELLESIINMS
ncbi:uncharacterized protein [Amphiura filiformis]|uniref:uncharacterized protein n=1 Tax=Amphiura filiformis TaxID=82378 RepID=UPI003B21793B